MEIAVADLEQQETTGLHLPLFAKRKFRFFIFISCLLATAYFTAQFYKEDTWSPNAYLLVFFFMFVGYASAGISLNSSLFGTFALLPNLNSYLPFGSFSVTWVELNMVLCILLMLRNPVKLTRFGLLSIGVFLSCILSLPGSPLGLLSLGLLLRFGILLTFVSLLVIQPASQLTFKSVFFGILMIPLMAVFTYSGEGALLGIFSSNFLSLTRAIYSFQYPIWFALLLPLLLYIKVPKLIYFIAVLFIGAVIVLSFARSVILGTGASALLFLFFYKDRRPVRLITIKVSLSVMIVVILVIAAMVLKFLDFKNPDNESNVARYEKMPIAFKNFKQHPLFGVGFGASSDKKLAEKRSASEVFQEMISPEFGPLTILAEIGLSGFFFISYLIVISVWHTCRFLRFKDISPVYKIVILIIFGGFFSSYLNSNSLAAIIVYLFITIPVVFYKNREYCMLSPRLVKRPVVND